MLDIEDEVVQAVLTDWRTAPVPERVRAALGFLEELTLRPAAVAPRHLDPLRRAGVPDRGIVEVVYICFLFSVMDRLADALDYELPAARSTRRVARFLHYLGYRLTSLPG